MILNFNIENITKVVVVVILHFNICNGKKYKKNTLIFFAKTERTNYTQLYSLWKLNTIVVIPNNNLKNERGTINLLWEHVIRVRNPSYHFRKIFNGKFCLSERNPKSLWETAVG